MTDKHNDDNQEPQVVWAQGRPDDFDLVPDEFGGWAARDFDESEFDFEFPEMEGGDDGGFADDSEAGGDGARGEEARSDGASNDGDGDGADDEAAWEELAESYGFGPQPTEEALCTVCLLYTSPSPRD